MQKNRIATFIIACIASHTIAQNAEPYTPTGKAELLVQMTEKGVPDAWNTLPHAINNDSSKWLQAGIYGDSYGRTDWAAALNHSFSNELKTGLSAEYTHDFINKDANNDGFRDLPKKKELSIANHWHFSKGRYTAELGIETLNNAYTGGSTHFKGRKADTTNYGVFTKRDRLKAWTSHSYAFNAKNMVEARLSYAYDYKEALYGTKTNQNNINTYDAQAEYIRTFNKHHTLRAGVTHNGYMTTNNLRPDDSLYIDNIESYANDFTTGIFTEYTFKIDSILHINVSAKGDWSYWTGFFYSPEVSISYNPYKSLVINANVSRKQTKEDVFANWSGLLMSSRQIITCFPYDKEIKWDFGLSATQKFKLFARDFSVTAGYTRTQFEKRLIIDFANSDDLLYLYFSDEDAHSDIVTLKAQYEIIKGLDATTAWRWSNVTQTIDGKLQKAPFVNSYDGIVSLSYTTPKYDFRIEADAQFYGGGRLPMAIDGSTHFDAYQLYNTRITKGFGLLSLYAGVDNIAGKTQRHPVLGHDNPFGSGFDATMIYAPLRDRTYYIGVRLGLEKR
ncbi:MAG: TonB-dependent receptor [Paludibacteraceae bacterium]|nr:TonB-dependent receptor [Paludibacteraceae bacterium]